ncbi:MAG: nucleotidyltransferase domain-containing protein [Thermoleptolyngbya sp. C42_A2020_037]|nr:nucleotidyltransferase domain-containing protein [Thermoleptolyngbya sp. C42_A2020_037]
MNQQLLQFIHRVVDGLQAIEGIVAIALSGSRARGNHTPKSDVDLCFIHRLKSTCRMLAMMPQPKISILSRR